MNSPTIPGQNSSGKKGAMVVRVPESTGTNTSPAAAFTASLISQSLCWLNNRWVFSITTMASSTTRPIPSRKAKSTMVLSVKAVPTMGPMMGISVKATNADSGTERATKIASATPMKNIRISTTKMNPSTTVLTRSFTLSRVRSDWSAVI